jgi:hypothetical protein
MCMCRIIILYSKYSKFVSPPPPSRTCKKATQYISFWQIRYANVDFKRFWRWFITVRITGFWDLVHPPVHRFSVTWMSFGLRMREQEERDQVSETLCCLEYRAMGRVQKLSHVCMKQFSILCGSLLLRNESNAMTSANIWSQIVVENLYFIFISHVSYEKQVLGSMMMILKRRNIWIKNLIFCY